MEIDFDVKENSKEIVKHFANSRKYNYSIEDIVDNCLEKNKKMNLTDGSEIPESIKMK